MSHWKWHHHVAFPLHSLIIQEENARHLNMASPPSLPELPCHRKEGEKAFKHVFSFPFLGLTLQAGSIQGCSFSRHWLGPATVWGSSPARHYAPAHQMPTWHKATTPLGAVLQSSSLSGHSLSGPSATTVWDCSKDVDARLFPKPAGWHGEGAHKYGDPLCPPGDWHS